MRTIVSLLEMVRAGFVLISRCLPNGSEADAEPLLESGLRVLTAGERAGDMVGDMAGERGRERMNPARRARGYMILSSIAELELGEGQLAIPSAKSMLRVNSDRFFYVGVRIGILTIYKNVGHLSPASDGGNGAGLDTVCTFSYNSRFRKLSWSASSRCLCLSSRRASSRNTP